MSLRGQRLEAMKVTHLKQELKLRGLSTTGNKTDLIERLLNRDDFEKELENLDEGNISEASNDEANSACLLSLETENDVTIDAEVLKQSPKIDSTNLDEVNTVENDLEKTTVNENKELNKQSFVSNNTSDRKLLLKRTCPLDFAAFGTSNACKKEVSSISLDTNQTVSVPLSVKHLTSEERLAMRAKRFCSSAINDKVTLTGGEKTESLIWGNSLTKRSQLDTTDNPLDIDILKKRAERFGNNVSAVMKQIEEKEKVLKRKMRFGSSTTLPTLTGSDEDRKRKRAERFGTAH